MVIGLSDTLKEGTFVWYNGKNMTYNNFYTGNIIMKLYSAIIAKYY